MSPAPPSPRREAGGTISRSAALVATGIFLSRCAGVIRSGLFFFYIPQKSIAADAFAAALRIPNFLQNLFGEGALSASFIPVYASLLGAKRVDDADRTARAVLALLVFVMSVLVLIGVLWTPSFVDLLTLWGYQGERRALTIQIVRVMFPGVGLLVISSWCLAILNSHGRFFLSYVAPVLWNVAMIATLVAYGRHTPGAAVVALAWGSVAGSALQLGVQVPAVWTLISGTWARDHLRVTAHVKRVLMNFVPIALSRGVVQVSAFVDLSISGWLPIGAPAALTNAQLIYTLPVSLFGMSISAAELPAMASATGAQGAAEATATLRARIENGQRAISALVIPSAVAFLALGDVIAATLFQRGKFHHTDAVYVWAILAGSAVGLLSSTIARLYSAAFYALGDTKTPVRFAILRVGLVAALGYVMAFPLPHALGIDPSWGAAGLTSSAGCAGWIEFALLRASLGKRIGAISLPVSFVTKVWLAALAAAAAGTAMRWVVPSEWMLRSGWLTTLRGLIILIVYGVVFLAIAQRARLLTLDELLRRFRKK